MDAFDLSIVKHKNPSWLLLVLNIYCEKNLFKIIFAEFLWFNILQLW